ncbi:MAG TPA: hypothetical protein VF463_13450 [Sphingobium sp.]
MLYSFSRLARSAAVAILPTLIMAPLHAAPAAARTAPVLATPAQIEAEKILLQLIQDPEVKAIKAAIKADLAGTRIGQTPDGAARIDYAVDEWTNSLIFKELVVRRGTPTILWSTDDTPRTWLGYTLPGVGTSGDNPDFIYRSAEIAGGNRYEISGQFDKTDRPAQFVLSVSGVQTAQTPLAKNKADLGNLLALLTDRDLKVKPDGSFRITFGTPGPDDSPNHIVTGTGPISVLFRDALSDWKQRPTRLSIRRLESGTVIPVDTADVRSRVLANLRPYISQWSRYPEQWFGGLQPNAITIPSPRDGGWGFFAGLRFQLKPDEAILVTTNRAGAAYAGIQVVDPWMIASDASKYQTSINLAQVKPNADGNYSYVIAPRDPGVANWLDSTGLHDGYAVLRWQVLPATTKGEDMLRDFRVIKLSEAAKIPGIALITPGQRQAALAARAQGYANRTR